MVQAGEVLFREVQRIEHPVVWAPVLLVPVLLIAIFGSALLRQELQGKAFGNVGRSALRWLATAMILLALAIPAFVASVRLTTEVRSDGLHVQLYPFHRTFKRMPLEGLARHEIRAYGAVREYGGWGIRRGRGGWAYTLGGDRGVQLRYANGDAVLIGTRQPEALLRAVEQLVATGGAR